jgi:NADPH:quinone reductase-like Zn-dependent oxidoreductase
LSSAGDHDQSSLGDLGRHPRDAADGLGIPLQVPSSRQGERLLISGGTTSVGLATAAIAKNHGAVVASTSRGPDREHLLRSSGADQVFIDTGAIAEQVKEVFPSGVDKVLELIGTTTLADSLRCAKRCGIVCMTGMVGNKWSFDDFSPMDVIPTAVCLTAYDGGRGFHADTAR